MKNYSRLGESQLQLQSVKLEIATTHLHNCNNEKDTSRYSIHNFSRSNKVGRFNSKYSYAVAKENRHQNKFSQANGSNLVKLLFAFSSFKVANI